MQNLYYPVDVGNYNDVENIKNKFSALSTPKSSAICMKHSIYRRERLVRSWSMIPTHVFSW